MRVALALVLALACLAPAAGAAPRLRTAGFQLQADGLSLHPLGTLASQANALAVSRFGNGGGLAGTATLGLTPHWCAGVRVAHSGTSKDGRFQFEDMAFPDGVHLPAGSGPYDIRRRLRMQTIHGLLQYRRAVSAGLELAAEGGAGIADFRETSRLAQGGTGLSEITGFQRATSWMLGVGLARAIPGNGDLVVGARYSGTLTGDGAVWLLHDDPGFAHAVLGIRYPHDAR